MSDDKVVTYETVPDLDQRWPSLLAAARAWKAHLIRGTSTSTAGSVRRLVEAIDAFDECDHPRLGWVFSLDGEVTCSTCGAQLIPPSGKVVIEDESPL